MSLCAEVLLLLSLARLAQLSHAQPADDLNELKKVQAVLEGMQVEIRGKAATKYTVL